MHQRILLLSFLISAIGFTGCSSTRFTASWQPRDVALEQEVNKVFVAAISPRLQYRQSTEMEIVRMFASSGLEAVASLDVIGPDYEPDSTKMDEFTNDLISKGFDMALAVSVLDVEESERYVQGNSYNTGYYGYRWGYYYPYYYGRVYEPGYYTTSTTVFLLTSIYNLNSRELLWTGQTETTDPASLNAFVRAYAKGLRKKLKKDKVFKD